MANKRYIEYRDPINSLDLDQARLVLARPGRYLGFNAWVPDNSLGNVGLRIYHSTGDQDNIRGSKPFTGKSDEVTYYGAVITRQGVAILSKVEDPLVDGIYIELSAPSSLTWYVFYISYKWVESQGGYTPIYGVYPFTPTDSSNPDPEEGLNFPNIEVPLGLFKIDPSIPGDTYDQITYIPTSTPEFAWGKTDWDMFARLDKVNTFQKANIFSLGTLAVTPGSSSQLFISDIANSFLVDTSGDTHISSIGSNTSEGGVFTLVFIDVVDTITIGDGVIRGLPLNSENNGSPVYKVNNGDTLTILQTDANEFYLLSLWPVPMQEIDTSDFARLHSANFFYKSQYWFTQQITEYDVSGGVLTLKNGNIVECTFNSAVNITDILDGVLSVNSGVFILHILKSSGSGISSSGNIVFPKSIGTVENPTSIKLYDGQSIILTQTESEAGKKWRIVSIWPILDEDLFYSSWVDVTPDPVSQSYSGLEWEYVKYKMVPGNTRLFYIKGRVKALSNISSQFIQEQLSQNLPTVSGGYFAMAVSTVQSTLAFVPASVDIVDGDPAYVRLQIRDLSQDQILFFNGVVMV